ncbi:MAG: ABC transporter substrate-binding protein [Anaerolineae bacterium]|nr:ABC transporter substrate-binding protein [Candidatus Roseilinea sp.]MDW8450400.1 ABC transporter substrate-binding protein [Anaerolineae bacterium]
MNKKVLIVSVFATLLVTCAAPPVATPGPAARPETATTTSPTLAEAKPKIIFGLDWAFVGQHAPFFVALEKGFWQEEGLDVEIVRGYGSADAVQKVAAGAVNIGYGDTGSLIVARTEGADVKLIGMVLGLPPYAVIYPMDKPIATPADLEGKKIGAAAGDSVRRVFPAFAKIAGFDVGKVEFITIGYEAYASQLLSRQIDGLAEYYAAKPNYDAAAKENNIQLGILKFSDYGLDIYSNGFLAKESYIKENPDIIRKFLRGAYRGFAYAYQHEDEAVDALLKREPTLNREVAKAQFLLDKDAVLNPDVLANGYGYIDPAKMQKTIEVMAIAYELKITPTPEELFTIEYLPSKQEVPPVK